MDKTTERQGNIELLRILCMFFVMFAHFNINAILRNDETSQELNYFALLVNSLLFVCLNTYILISGYYSIKLKVKSILSLLIQTEFYAVLAICIFALFSISSCSNFTIGKHILVGMIPFRPYGLWFIPSYASLLIISPLLNWICEGKKTHALSIAVIGLGGLILYLTRGYLGNSVANFILIYLIGRWIALYVKKNNKRQKYLAIFLLLLSVGLTFCLELWWLQRGNSVADKMIFSHSTPWIIASSVALFVLFKNILCGDKRTKEC